MLDAIDVEIKKSLKQIVQEYRSKANKEGESSKWWTKKIKDALCQLGHNMKCVVSANRCDCADEKEEWLFDMVWSFPIGKWNEIKLAMECEWSLDEWEIWRDFEKLLVVRSKYRVFIFTQSNDDKVKKMINEFQIRIKNFESTVPGDRYLFAGYSPEKVGFIFQPFVATKASI